MQTNTYIYDGKTEAFVLGVGVVQPGQLVETTLEINHPLFTKKENKKKGK